MAPASAASAMSRTMLSTGTSSSSPGCRSMSASTGYPGYDPRTHRLAPARRIDRPHRRRHALGRQHAARRDAAGLAVPRAERRSRPLLVRRGLACAGIGGGVLAGPLAEPDRLVLVATLHVGGPALCLRAAAPGRRRLHAHRVREMNRAACVIGALAFLLPANPAFAHGDHAALAWTFDPFVIGLLLLSAGIYSVGTARLWRHAGIGRGIRSWRALSYGAGWLLLAGALVS